MADSISDLQKDTFYWQRLLRLAGYYHGAIDGIPGNGTRNGTERWSTDADRYKMEIGCFDERTERNISTLLPEAQKAARQCSNWPGMKPSTRDMKQKLSAERARMPNRMTSTGNALK